MHDAGTTSRDLRPLIRWSLVAAVVIVPIVALAVLFDWNWFKGPFERHVSTAMGRDFRIHGNLDVNPGRVITVTMERVTLGNPDRSSRSETGRADRVRIDVEPWPLLRGVRVFPRIEIDRPRLLLERDASGAANWSFQPTARRPLYLGVVIVRDGVLELHDALRQTDLRMDVDSVRPGPRTAPLAVVLHATGRHRDGKLVLAGRIDSPSVMTPGGRYRVDLHGRAGATRAHVFGQVPMPVDVRHFSVLVAIAGDDLADLYPLLGLATPETPPYALAGRLSRDGNVVRFRDFSGTVGDSDMSGDVSVTFGGERPFASGSMASRRLDFDDLAGLLGAPPGTAPGESASPQQEAEATRRAMQPRVLPDRPYELEKLRSMDADVHFRAASVDAGKLPINSMSAQLRLDDGLLHLQPLDFGVAGGHLTGDIRLDARRNPIETVVDLRGRDMQLPKLSPRAVPDSVGLVAGDARLQGRGNSVADMFATANGDVGLVMGRGRFSNLKLEMAGLDVAESLKFLLTKDRMVRLRCAYADFDVNDGVMHTEDMVFDTSDTVMFGRGTIDLRNEELGLELLPRPKDVSPVSLRVPLEVRGTFKHPSIAPKRGPLAARIALAAALFAVAPPASLLALIETGPGKDVECRDEPQQSRHEAPLRASSRRGDYGL